MTPRIRHITTFLLLLLMVCGGKAWGQAWDGSVATSYASGSGTQADPYIVSNGAELAYFGSQYKDKTYWVKVTNDIDLGGNTWPETYSKGKYFKGHLIGQKADGTRPTISNYTLTIPNAGANYGLISSLNNASIEGINVSNVSITYSERISVDNVRASAFVGYMTGSTTITDCSAQNVSVTYYGTTKSNTAVGSLVAYSDGTTVISNCTTSGCSVTVVGDVSGGCIGGLVGISNSANARVTNCSTTHFTVTANASIVGGAYIGGLMGQLNGAATMSQCESTDFTANINNNVTGAGSIGGLIGQSGTISSISQCRATSPTININANVTAGVNFGGLIGYNSNMATISKCQTNNFTINVNGNVTAGSAGGLIANCSSINATIEDCTVNGVTYVNQAGNNYQGANWAGFIGYLKGLSTDYNVQIRRNSVSNINITYNGTLNASANIGGFIGYAHQFATVDNAKATNVNISLGGNIQTGEIRIGGMIGFLEAKSTVTNCLLEGSNNKIHSSNTGLTIGYDQIVHIGGIIGVTATQSSTEANKTIIDNCAAYCDIDLSGYSLTSSTNARKASFVVGGVIGGLRYPAYLPQTLYYSGKVNAPYAMVGPLVGVFLKERSNAAYIYDDYSGMNGTAIITNGDYSHWYYGNYQLYLNDAVVTSGKTMNVTPSGAGYVTIGDISTWTGNMIGATNKVSKTILPYSSAPSPAWTTNSNNYPAYYMYYAQGVNRGNYATDMDAVISAFKAIALELATGASWDTSDNHLAFGDSYITSFNWNSSNHKYYDITVKKADGTDAPSSYYYVWKVAGVEQAGNGATGSFEALMDSQSATVDIYSGSDRSNFVASIAFAIPHAEWIEIGADANPSGSGTEADPYLISTAAELGWVARYERDHTAAVRYYMLTADIDLSGAWWTPVGGIKRDKLFYGVFDGNQKTISNLTGEWISMSETHSYGLFGAIGGQTNGKAEVKNLSIDHAQFRHVEGNSMLKNEVDMGIIAGSVSKFASIKNIVVTNSSITGSAAFNVNQQNLLVGGAIGKMSLDRSTDVDAHFNIYNLFVDVDIEFAANCTNSTSNYFKYNVGGVIGQIRATYDAAYRLPQSIYYTGSIKAPQAAVGPIFANAANYKTDVSAALWISQYEGYSNDLHWTDHKYGEYRIWPYGATDYITITDKSNLTANSVTSTWTVTGQTSKTESVANTAVGKVQGVNTGEYVANLEDVVTMFRANQDPIADVFDWAVDGDAIKMVEASLVVVLTDNTTTENNEHTLSLQTNHDDSEYTYEWIVNGVSSYTGQEKTHTFNIGGSPQLIYVKAYPNGSAGSTVLATSSVIDLPRVPLTATYSPMRTRELNGADFDGVFTVTPDASTSDGYSMTYTWKEKSDDDQWDDLAAGTSATASADGKTCSTAGASASKTYQCTITATDNDWLTYMESITDGDSPCFARKTEFVNKYSQAIICTIEVEFMKYKAVYLDPSVQYGGSDDNDGTKEHPVKTWKKAYSLLEPDGTVYDNYVILMSEYAYNTTDRGLCNLDNLYNNGNATPNYATWEANALATGMCVPATITSYLHDNNGNVVAGEIDYSATGSKPAIYKMTVSRAFLGILADTRFEWMTFSGAGGDYNCLFAQYYNLEFGHGLKMTHFANGTNYGVLCSGSKSCSFQIFGGINNDARFKSDPRGFEEHLPHAKEGHKIIFRSGYFSNVCVTGRQTGASVAGICGTPRVPVKCQIIIDIDREWNDTYKKCISENGDANAADKSSANYDIAMLLAGNHEGSQYGDVDLIILSGNVARVVNGILGAQTRVNVPSACGGGTYPLNSYMGRANILMDPSKMVDAYGNIVARTGSYSDESVYVTELYGGGLGRRHSSDGLLNVPVYGANSVTINGGTIGIVPAELAANPSGLSTVLPAVFGGASGGVNGIGDDASRNRNSDDITNESLPYWYVSQEDGRVGYCNYATWKTKTADKHVYVRCYDGVVDGVDHYTDVDLQYAKTSVTINGGTFGTAANPLDGIYGGGSGYINSYIFNPASQSSYPFTDAGTLYGKPGEVASSVTINGGTFYCNIYGAGRGSDFYYTKQMAKGTNYNSRYAALARVYGNVEVNVNGGTIHGNIYGGGAGYAEAKLYNTNAYGQLTDMARLTGNTQVNIGGNAVITTFQKDGKTIGGNVYGGGMLAGVTGQSMVNVSGTARIDGNVFAAAQGIPPTTGNSLTLPGTLKQYVLNTAANNVLFGIVTGNTEVDITQSPSVNGNVYGGAESAFSGTANENGSTTATVNVNTTGGTLNDIYGGGSMGDVRGDTRVNIDAGTVSGSIYGGGALANTGNTTVNLLGGTVHDVYGGGLGRIASQTESAVAATVGSTTVNVGKAAEDDMPASGAVIYGSVFGCNNLNGTPTGNATVNVYKTSAKGTESDENPYHVFAVYGGGNKATYDPLDPSDKTTLVEVFTCDNSIQYVYGGGNAASSPATNVIIHGGNFDWVFGGGNGKTEPGQPTNPGADVGYKTSSDDEYGAGTTLVGIHGGVINHLFAGSNTLGRIRVNQSISVDQVDCDMHLAELYGGGNEADGNSVTLTIGCTGTGRIDNVYGGAKSANLKGDVVLNIRGGNIGNVFGGNNVSGTIGGSITVNVDWDGTCGDNNSIDNVYGGGNQAAYDSRPSEDSSPRDYPEVNINNAVINESVFGGGLGASATVIGNPQVNINTKPTPDINAGVEGHANVTHSVAVNGSVYGGGSAAPVTGNPAVRIQGWDNERKVTVEHHVFGAGYGATATVSGSTEVKILGNTEVKENVYGGGNGGDVEGDTDIIIGEE